MGQKRIDNKHSLNTMILFFWQNNISVDLPAAPSRAISMPALIDSKTDEVKGKLFY